MLNEKVKEIIIIVTLSFFIAIIFNSCAKAWTYDEFKDLSTIIANGSHGDATTAAQWFLNNQTTILNKIGEDYDDYANFMMVRQTGSTNYFNFYMWNGGTTTINTSVTISNYGTAKYLRFKSNGDFSWYQDYTSSISWSVSKCYALQSNIINDYGSALLENYLNYIVVEDEKDLNSLAYYLGDMRIGAKYEYSPVVKLFKDNTEIPITLSLRPPSEVNGGTLYQIWIDTQNGLDAIVNGNLYNIRCYNNDVEVIRSNYFILNNNLPVITVVPVGQITNASGEITGAINLEGLAENIGKQFYNSGDSGEKGIIQKVYDDLFTISDSYIENKLKDIQLDLNSSGDIELEKAFINLISGETKGDFIIAWSSGKYNNYTIIPSGEINFSAMERNNEALKETMKWARVILGFSFGALLIKNCWNTLMHTFGIGVQVYDKNKDEQENANKGAKT